jgi:uncharacterized protein YndB with AHSA1/START domain
MRKETTMDTHVARHALALSRLLPAAPDAAFAAFTDPDRIRAFWGPAGFSVDSAKVDLRAGGSHEVAMRGPTGETFTARLLVEAVEPPRRLVLRVPEPDPCGVLPGAVGEILFLPDPAGTRLAVTWDHVSAAQRAKHEEIGFARCWHEMLDKFVAHLVTPADLCPGVAPPSALHGWLHRMLGTWSYECQAEGPPGASPMTARGVEQVRSLGGYWVVGESEGTCPGLQGPQRMVVTLGADPATGRVRGNWVGSMMPHMFLYDGALSEDGTTLTLDSEGPAMDGQGTARYRDIVELRDEGHRVVTCQVQGRDGGWTTFMTNHFRRGA